jgi:FkbM family methyltransferase
MKSLQQLPKAVARKIARQLRLTCPLPHSFSQEGEDMILNRVFESRASGFYVDVGAHHPVRFSNTYLFYRRGWRGINIDAMPGSMTEFEKMRPEDKNVEALISSEQKKVELFLFNEPALNTCDSELARKRNGLSTFRLLGTTMIESQTLSEVLERYLPPKQSIDFLSIDVEGMDLDVLCSNDWKRFRPTVILAEDAEVSNARRAIESPIGTFLGRYGYSLFANTVNTLLFRKDDPLAS